MTRFILVGFGFLALVFYEMSGGADFDPVEARNAAVLARVDPNESRPQTEVQAVAAQIDDGPTVTRMSLNLTSFKDVVDEKKRPKQAILTGPVAGSGAIPAQAASNTITTTPVTFANTQKAERVLPSIIFPGSRAQASSDAVATRRDIRFVSASVVNMRGGPGTGFDVVTKLDRDTEVVVLQDDGTGWVKLRAVSGGPEGWIADFLLNNG